MRLMAEDGGQVDVFAGRDDVVDDVGLLTSNCASSRFTRARFAVLRPVTRQAQLVVMFVEERS